MADLRSVQRSPTFLVGTNAQKQTLEGFHKEEQHLEETYSKNKPLCFNGRAHQKTHPEKTRQGHKDADATLAAPIILGVADGVSQVEEYGMDASLLPHELLRMCEEIAMSQLMPGHPDPDDPYKGPIPLLREAFELSPSLGSTTVVLSLLDNGTRIHGKLHPMMAVITVGDCELLVLRRIHGRMSMLEAVFHTEMQRIDGHAQTPLQLARVNDDIDPDWDESVTIDVIERGSAVHCVSAYEGDIVVVGSDGVFDNLFLDEMVELCNAMLPPRPGRFEATSPDVLNLLARNIVNCCHEKTRALPNPYGSGPGDFPEAPIGRGGKMDDTSVVVAEIVEWTEDHDKSFAPKKGTWDWMGAFVDSMSCGADSCSVQVAQTYETDEVGHERTYDEGMLAVGGPQSARPGLRPEAPNARHPGPPMSSARISARSLAEDSESDLDTGHTKCTIS